MLKFFLCFKYLRKKKIVFFGIAAVALSCALLIVVASLFTAFIDAIQNSASDTIGDIVITPPVRFAGRKQLIGRLETNPAIEAASGVLFSRGLLHLGKGNVRTVSIWGIDAAKEGQVTTLKQTLLKQRTSGEHPCFGLEQQEETLAGFVGIGVVIQPGPKTDEYDFDHAKEFIGKQAILTTGAVIEQQDTGTLSAPTGRGKFKRKTRRLIISDIVHSGIYDLDKQLVYLPIDKLQKMLYPQDIQTDQADMVRVRLAVGVDVKSAIAVIREIWSSFAVERLNWGQYAISSTEIQTAAQMQGQYVVELRKQMGVLMLIFGVLCAAAVLLIFCIFYMIVITRRKDIAIIKSCGLSSLSVAQLFVWFGLIVGVAGSAVGAGCGYIIIKNINPIEEFIRAAFGLKLWQSSVYIFSTIPNQINIESVLWVSAAAIVACMLGSLIPAIAAARLVPIKILRYE